MIKKIALILSVLFIGSLASMAIDLPAEELTPGRRAIKSIVKKCKIEDLFKEHHLCQNWQEFSYAEEAASTADDLLDEEYGQRAIPYLLYAEKYWQPSSVSYLWQIADSKNRFKDVPLETKALIKERFLTQNVNIPYLVGVYRLTLEANARNLNRQKKYCISKLYGAAKKSIISFFDQSPDFSLQGISSAALYDEAPPSPLTPLTPQNVESDLIPLLGGRTKKD